MLERFKLATHSHSRNKEYQFWQYGNHAEEVYSNKFMWSKLDYIHLNPVKHKFIGDFKQYPHSSFRSYISDKTTNLKREYVLELFGGIENFEFCHHEKQLKYEGLIDEIDIIDI